MAERVHLDRKLEVETLLLAQPDQAVEECFPVAVARKVVVGDEKSSDVLRKIVPDHGLEVVGGSKAALAALHIDDGAERALIGTATSEIDARHCAGRPPHVLCRQDRHRLVLHVRQVRHEVVERTQRARERVPQNSVEAPVLSFAGK